ncbi:unnamed protein product (macronuclear) [Paramecium tetraurelia]|uniref:60S ribosomal protein L31 n=1 Tax=Paramecium tetraurelia TaxID=5888 RepID=A0DTB2_PARTE|nr:uncharacterized protein GSPATT00019972001 [Paramecium tetraurelia]CAK86279.1 unnamed protein product [Paramecium tetraurelia]|eukprot:XP_001453676.1 hypothetical protein (macronuclear) [Paramecium tetraurelia strain d4-2]
MYKQNDQLKGWDIEQSMDSDDGERKQVTQVSSITKTSPSDRLCLKKVYLKSPQLSPLRVHPSIHQTTPLRNSIQQKFVFSNQLINKKKETSKYNIEMEQSQRVFIGNAKVQQPVNIAHLRIKLNGIPGQPQHIKAYTQNQLQAIMHLKRRNLYLKSVLKKVCHESDERYSHHQNQEQQEIFLGYRWIDDDTQKLQSQNNSMNLQYMFGILQIAITQEQQYETYKGEAAIVRLINFFFIYFFDQRYQINYLFEMVKKEKGKPNPLGEVSRDYTINLHKGVHKETFKRKAPRAVSYIVNFARKNMLTEDVRIDPSLNEAVWARGIRNLPRRIRVRLQRKKKEEDDGKGKYYTLAQHVPVDTFDGLKTEITKSQ